MPNIQWQNDSSPARRAVQRQARDRATRCSRTGAHAPPVCQATPPHGSAPPHPPSMSRRSTPDPDAAAGAAAPLALFAPPADAAAEPGAEPPPEAPAAAAAASGLFALSHSASSSAGMRSSREGRMRSCWKILPYSHDLPTGGVCCTRVREKNFDTRCDCAEGATHTHTSTHYLPWANAPRMRSTGSRQARSRRPRCAGCVPAPGPTPHSSASIPSLCPAGLRPPSIFASAWGAQEPPPPPHRVCASSCTLVL